MKWIAFLLLSMTLVSCYENFLDMKPDKRLVVPRTLEDLQGLLDDSEYMNLVTPHLGVASGDDYYFDSQTWESLPEYAVEIKNGYIWAKDVYAGQATVTDWHSSYRRVFIANLALEGIEKLQPSTNEQVASNNIKGSALFYRAWSFFQLAQLFCKQYDIQTAKSDLGIPLRLFSDINIPTTRATVEETYEQIVQDLIMAVPLLPVTPLIKTRPSKPAAYAMLAKTYLQMGDFSRALPYADSCLMLYDLLIDYDTLDMGENFAFEEYNDEVIFHTAMNSVLFSRLNVDSTLYNSYDQGDLRQKAYFLVNGDQVQFRGSYHGGSGSSAFSGIATDEVYLMKAECLARGGDSDAAMNVLNSLLRMRFGQEDFLEETAGSPEDALAIILEERRKELPFRGIHWADLRRLNQDNRFAKTLVRQLNTKIYQLAPGDSRYVLPIPDIVLELSDIEQNPR